MRKPSEVAKQIKLALKYVGIKATTKSINYKITITADGTDQARQIATNVYHMEHHGWLTVCVDGHILPMPACT